MTIDYLACELCINSSDCCISGSRDGRVGPQFVSSFLQAMGLRQVADLTEYSTAELLLLIQLAISILRQRLSGGVASASQAESDVSLGISVVEPEAPAATTCTQASAGSPPGLSSTSSTRVDVGFEPPQRLRNPWTCEFHCKFCQVQCCRPGPHTNHACVEHRRLR